MNTLITYQATDRRVYNGALCSDMQKEVNQIKYLEDRMKKANPTSSCTFFPVEGKFLVFINSGIRCKGAPQILTNNFHANKQDALIEAITLLEKD